MIVTPSAKPLSQTDRSKHSLYSPLYPMIEPHLFSQVVEKMRLFFTQKGFLEVHTQNRLSILAACEDPFNIGTYDYAGQTWPLPQTGQMWLEYELLHKSDVPGYFCVSTSYRNEPNAEIGRHCMIFPMFEFEMHGGLDEMVKMEEELVEFLGFGDKNSFPGGEYLDVAKYYGVKELESEHETLIEADHGPVFFLKHFPEYTSPFWNMKRNELDKNIAEKVDVLLHGQETIGSAERSCDAQMMWDTFHTIEDGKYAAKIFELFGKERVIAELEEFLSFEFFPRSGGGIGMTRMIRAMQMSNLLND
jgi:aspartyl/asparaginyl-tRNA synthetase